MAGIEFEAPLELVDRGGAVVTIPPEVYEELGGSGRIPVNATFDGISYRGSIVRMGGRPILGVLKAIRNDLGVGEGDVIVVTVERDDAERTVELPEDLAAALGGHHDARAAFGRLSYTHQREYVQWIEEAKRSDTRQRRITGTIERLTSS